MALKYKWNLQMFGGNGNSSPSGKLGGATGGLNGNDILSTSNLLVDTSLDSVTYAQVTTTLKDFQDEYGLDYFNTRVAKLKPGTNALAYYDGEGIAINKSYLNAEKMQRAMENDVALGYHPGMGNKSGLEAVTAHELGHAVTDLVSVKLGNNHWTDFDKTSKLIVEEASLLTRHKGNTISFARKISGYAQTSNAECIAEAISDCYCNGKKATSESKAIKRVIDKYLK